MSASVSICQHPSADLASACFTPGSTVRATHTHTDTDTDTDRHTHTHTQPPSHTSAVLRLLQSLKPVWKMRITPCSKVRLAYVSIRQHTSAYASIRQKMRVTPCSKHTSAYVSIRQHTPAYTSIRQKMRITPCSKVRPAYVSIRQHTSAYVSIRQHTPADANHAL